MRINRSATGKRRSHHTLTNPRLATDKTGVVHIRHRMSPDTGMYRGRTVVDMTKKDEKKSE